MPLFDWEKEVFLSLQGLGSPALDQLMIFSSSFIPWLPIAAALLFYVYRQQTKMNFLLVILYLLLLVAMSDSSTSYLFKNLFARLRPCHMEELKSLMVDFGQRCGGKHGFFSSHAANSFALGYFLMSFAKVPKFLKISIWMFLFLIAYSRIYLGVHLPLDVIVGSLWGLALSRMWVFIAKNSVTEPVST